MIWIIAYFLVGVSAFYAFHRFIRYDKDDVGDHFMGFIVLFLWPVAALCFAVVSAGMGIVWLGNKIKGD